MYGFNDIHVYQRMEYLTGRAAVAVAIRRTDGTPAAALHVTWITPRVTPPRRGNIVATLMQERTQLEANLQPALDAAQILRRTLV